MVGKQSQDRAQADHLRVNTRIWFSAVASTWALVLGVRTPKVVLTRDGENAALAIAAHEAL